MSWLVQLSVGWTVTSAMLKKGCGLILVWAATVGASIALFANLLAPPDMADWAWGLVAPWQERTPEFWDWFAVRFGLTLPNWLVPPLNFASFLLLTAIGVRILEHGRQERVVLNYPFLQLFAGMLVMIPIAYILLAGQSRPSGAEDIPSTTPLVILLAAAAVSFSPAMAGRGNLIKRLWFMLAGLGVLIAFNELSKLASDT